MFAVGMCIDERYLLPAFVAIGSLAEACSARALHDAALRILALDLTRAHAETLAAYARAAGFGSFDLAWSRPAAGSVMADRSYITPATYLRFGFTRQFVDRPYVIYLDADVLALGDVAEPLAHLGERAVGMVADEFNPVVGVGTALPGLADCRPRWRGLPYYNAGVLWMPVGMLATMRRGVDLAQRRWHRHIHHNDQDALNLWLLESGRVQPVEGCFNRFEVGRFLQRGDWVRRVVHRPLDSRDARLIHFVGPLKPWSPACPGTEDVRAYRGHVVRAVRRVNRLGDLSIEAVSTAGAR